MLVYYQSFPFSFDRTKKNKKRNFLISFKQTRRNKNKTKEMKFRWKEENLVATVV